MNEKRLLLISGIIFVALLVIAFLLPEDFAMSMNLVFIGMIVLILPFSVHKFLEFKKIKLYEEQFPNFLRDVAEAQRAGLTIVQAIKLAARSDYGTLSKEVKKINDQLSWNIPLESVIKNFRNRVKNSEVITKSLLIIEQANRSGGNIEDTMDSLASNIESIKEVQEEKSTLLNQQVLMMYAIFFIFLGITIALVKFLVPMLQSQVETQAGGGTSFALFKGFNANPCYACISGADPECLGCNMFFTVSSIFGFGDKSDPSSYYKSLFFIMILVQGLFSGLIAGQIGSDSVVAGTKHSLIMLISGGFAFITVVRLGFI